ncbi:alginate O-acetyltransferase AlgF [Cohaesibacter haloalkalitolerans]|uniref:alginate O-acetyltransferase AlgF n=1 Tax=Cohaesibacter haloalkalitolerans TaxID=1162980 RepID=UPI000E64FD7D|nr:alginate O-acetyltransferase AlgF [Cohaesibacter haloalkalitolerans]
MFKTFHFAFFLMTSIVLAASGAKANDTGLYGKALDPNSSFVRVLVGKTTAVRIASKVFPQLENGVSPYIVVSPSTIDVAIGDKEGSVDAKPGKFYTIVLNQSDDLSVIDDQIAVNPAKASLSFYNMSDVTALDFYVPQAKANAVSALASGHAQTVQLKAPLTLDFSAMANGAAQATVQKVLLERGSGTSIIAESRDGQFMLRSVRNEIAR